MKRVTKREYDKLIKEYKEELDTTNLITQLYILLNNDLTDPFLVIKNAVNQRYKIMISTSCLDEKIEYQVFNRDNEVEINKTQSTLTGIIEISRTFLGNRYSNFVSLA